MKNVLKSLAVITKESADLSLSFVRDESRLNVIYENSNQVLKHLGIYNNDSQLETIVKTINDTKLSKAIEDFTESIGDDMDEIQEYKYTLLFSIVLEFASSCVNFANSNTLEKLLGMGKLSRSYMELVTHIKLIEHLNTIRNSGVVDISSIH